MVADTYNIKVSGFCIKLSLMFLIAIATSIIPLLLNTDTAIFYTSQPLYITILILFMAVIYYRFWGLIIGAVTFTVYGIILDIPSTLMLINSGVNILQLILLLLSYIGWLKLSEYADKRPDAEKTFVLSKYNYSLIVIFILYLICSIMKSPNTSLMRLYAFAAMLSVTILIKAVSSKDYGIIYFAVFIGIVPSLLSSSLSAFLSDVPSSLRWDYITLWTLSNYILIQTVGYLMKDAFHSNDSVTLGNNEYADVNISTVLYYVAIVAWNIFILYLMYLKLISSSSYVYFFPWALGNAFLISNFYFSIYNDAETVEDKFSWYENRIIVVEKNTSGIITIISFLLPLSVTLLNDIPDILIVMFIANIFCALLSLGLIWIPSRSLKFISLLKRLKTIFYLYSITLLLMSVIMIMLH